MTVRSYKVAFAQFPGNGISRMETNAWVVQTVRNMDHDLFVSAVVSLTYADTPIPMLRNRAVLDARAEGCDYLLMIDSDMAPDLPYPGARPFWDEAWGFMMDRRDREAAYLARFQDGPPTDAAGRAKQLYDLYPPATVAAPYNGPPPDECCYIFSWVSRESDTPDPNFRLEMIPRESAAIRSGIQEVAALPTGLILYDMRVFEVLPPPWYRYEFDAFEARKNTTEDVYQTRNASLLGLPQYVSWSSWAGHAKVKIVGRPHVVSRDEVHSSLVQAVLRGVDSNERLVFLGPEDKEGSDGDRGDRGAAPVRAVQGLLPAGAVPQEQGPVDGP
jgi:hypothetical protein